MWLKCQLMASIRYMCSGSIESDPCDCYGRLEKFAAGLPFISTILMNIALWRHIGNFGAQFRIRSLPRHGGLIEPNRFAVFVGICYKINKNRFS